MAFQVSPGVRIKEVDATNVVPATSSSIGGFVGAFNWGPVEKVTLVGSENQLAETFYQPNDSTAKYFLPAAGFLKYGNALKVVRVVDSSAKNAHSEGSGSSNGQSAVTVKNDDSYLSQVDGLNAAINWVAKFPGLLGNSLRVEVCPVSSSDSVFNAWAYAGQFDSAPGTSVGAGAAGKAGDELHVVVLDKDGLITGTQNTVLERYSHVSQLSDVKDASGASLHYKDVINLGSDWVRWTNHDSTNFTDAGKTLAAGSNQLSGATVDTHSAVLVFEFLDGVDGNAPTTGNIATGYDFFNDSNVEEVSLLFASADANGAITIANDLISIATARKDCMAFVSPPLEDTINNVSTPVDNVLAFANLLTDSSYGFCDSGALYVYDKYNDKFRYIAASGHMAGLCANTDNVADAWFSPAGLTRGALLGVVKLAHNPDSAGRDKLYKGRVNPIVSMPGQGIILFGDKTLLKRPSAFDRVNVRRLFIALEKSISTAAKGQLFEFNDEFTRAQFLNLVEPFLRDVKGRRGITDFNVVCDGSNNTSQVIDSNQFVADIFIKPARSINFITLSFIATRSGVEFSEIAGQV
jgi:phage tail sheath protein FI